MINIKTTCPFCGKENIVEVDEASYERWENGELIQNVWPDMSPATRELLITGICDSCFPS